MRRMDNLRDFLSIYVSDKKEKGMGGKANKLLQVSIGEMLKAKRKGKNERFRPSCSDSVA